MNDRLDIVYFFKFLFLIFYVEMGIYDLMFVYVKVKWK